MREIEFRGKKETLTEENKKYTNGWIYSDTLYKDDDGVYLIPLGVSAESYHLGKYNFRANSDRFEIMVAKIKPETLGQYTGLKDKNGTKIFEGDIVQLTRTKMRAPTASFNGQDIVSKHLIYWDEERHAFHQKHYTEERCIGGGSIDFEDVRAEENIIEVIGNIHDNPELLKE